MYYDLLVKVPENTGKITMNKRNGATYVEYTYDRKYIPEKKYNVALRTTIGKLDPTDPTMMNGCEGSNNSIFAFPCFGVMLR